VDIAVDASLLATFNQGKHHPYTLLPEHVYTLSSNTLQITQAGNSATMTISVQSTLLTHGLYVLPIVISNISEFAIDNQRNVYYLTVTNVGKIDHTTWTVKDFTDEATNEGVNNRNWAILTDDPLTYWHQVWSGSPSPLPIYITIDMHHEVYLTSVELQRRNNQTGTRAGNFYISSDNISFVKIGEFSLPAAAQNSLQAFDVVDAVGRYLKVEVTEIGGTNNSALSLVRANGFIVTPSTAGNHGRLNREGWEIEDVSSEATNETENNRAFAILNDDANTYWHTWYGTPAHQLPHHITIDMKKELTVSAIELLRRSGNTLLRGGKFYTSLDGTTFTEVGSFTLPATAFNHFSVFPVTETRGRYLKIEITDVVDSNGYNSSALSIVHVRGTE
jgi:hypothetical protein